MRKSFIKIISIVLSLLMIFCTIPIATMSVGAAEESFLINNKRYSASQLVKNVNYYCTCPTNNHYCCVQKGTQAYAYVWGRSLSGQDTSNNFLKSIGRPSLNANNLKKYLSVSEPGAAIYAVRSNDYSYGHFMIFLKTNSNNTGAWMLDPNYDGKGSVRVSNYTWSSMLSKFTYSGASIIRYIAWPNASSQTSRLSAKTTVTTNAATNISNYSATISGKINNGTASSWGFDLGTSSSNLVTKSSNCGSNCDIKKYAGELKAGTTYYYRMWAMVGGSKVSGSVKSFTTTKKIPGTPSLTVNNKDVAIGETVKVSWSATSNTQNYIARLYDSENNVVETKTVQGTSHAFQGLKTSGTYYATVTSKNNAGEVASAKQTVIVHPDVTVKFVDYDGTELCEPQTVGYNKSANAPAAPIRKGYTFSKWDNSYTNVKEDTTVTATYTINKYKVTFKNENGETLKTEEVEYQKSATAPEVTTADGYKLIGWDKDFSCVEENMIVTANIDWYNKNFAVHAKIDSAVRVVDSDDESNEGYDVDVTITNNDEKLTRGRVIVALQTAEGKLLTSTESAAFSIQKSNKKQINVFVPYNNAATIAKVFVVSQYSSAIPIAASTTIEIDQTQAYTNWSEEKPPEDVAKYEERTEYRYKTKSTTTSYNTSLSGWTQTGSQWIQSGSGSIDYVSSWPSGFNKSHWIYNSYNKTPKAASETATTKTNVSTSTVGYVYYHWCRGDNVGAVNRMISYNYTSKFKAFHAFTRSTPLSYSYSADAFKLAYSSCCNSTYWWNSANPNSIAIRRCSYVDYKKLFSYEKWSDFSDWSTTSKTADNNTVVETRKVYRYLSNDAIKEDTEGKERTISGNLGAENAGKKLTLFIYKVNSASDYSNEYVGQTEVGEDGAYSFTFKLREEPTVDTGDYTVELGLEGASTGIFLDPIKAPKKTYKVKFYDYQGNVISEQNIEEGNDAVIPSDESMQREGYTFINWTESNRNIREDLDFYPNYKLNEYTVVFVDWTSKYVSMEKFKHGEVLKLPELGTTDEDKVIKWDGISSDKETVVTKDMIITTVIEDKIVEAEVEGAEIFGFDKKYFSKQSVKYDTAVELPEIADTEDYIFLGWKVKNSEDTVTDLTDSVITENVKIYPEYVFAKTVEMPTCNVESGEYDTAQTIELNCATEDSVIYYTIDGTDPATSETAIEYIEPFTLDKSCQLRFIAMSLGMNNSGECSILLAINTGLTAYHILNIVSNTLYNTAGYSALVKDGFTLDVSDFENLYEGYTFEAFYYDSDYTEEFLSDVETVTETLTLYAKYNPKKYTVTFKDDDGTIVSTQTVEYSQAAEAPEMSKDGYVFVGWDSDAYLCVEKDTELTAKYVLESEYATVKLNRSKISILEGLQFPLKATVSPVELSDKEIVWNSSDSSVASVDENGRVTGESVGTATISVMVVETGETAECSVTVSGNPEKAIYLNKNSYLDFDNAGYLRRIAVDTNTIGTIRQQFMNNTALKFYNLKGTELSDSSLLGTGSVIKLLNGDTVVDEVTCVMTGDYTGDGIINNKDTVALSRKCIDKQSATEAQMLAIDVNGDGYINNRDSALLSRYLVGKEEIE